MSVSWESWGAAAFERAKKEKKPVLVNLFSSSSLAGRELDAAYDDPELSALVQERFVAVREDADDRPDLLARYAPGGGSALVLDADACLLAGYPLTQASRLKAALGPAADSFDPSRAGSPSKQALPVWTGAVGAVAPRLAPDAAWPKGVLSRVKAAPAEAFPCLDCLEFLLYGACEWSDGEALKILARRLQAFSEGTFWDRKLGGASKADSEKRLDVNARLARLFYDAFSLTQEEPLRRAGEAAIGFMTRELFDPAAGAFFHCRPYKRRKTFYADGNAMAVLALLKASAFPGGRQHLDAANQALVFLSRMADARLGMAHLWSEGAAVHGLLSDNAWAMLAFTESYLMSGYRPHRELADALLKHLFQEMWERERGGFLDRVASRKDPRGLSETLVLSELNAVAFEAAWRVHQLKGNPNYRKWIEWGLGSVAADAAQGSPCAQAPLARVADLLRRGRLDLELVGRMGDSKTEALLAALHRHYLPRKIISYVDPDDQDYIMAHKLEAESYPRLFGCIELKPKVSAESPEKIPELLRTLNGAA